MKTAAASSVPNFPYTPPAKKASNGVGGFPLILSGVSWTNYDAGSAVMPEANYSFVRAKVSGEFPLVVCFLPRQLAGTEGDRQSAPPSSRLVAVPSSWLARRPARGCLLARGCPQPAAILLAAVSISRFLICILQLRHRAAAAPLGNILADGGVWWAASRARERRWIPQFRIYKHHDRAANQLDLLLTFCPTMLE
jgi:hypothetical protein